jgi:hypothetical protein
MNTSDGKMESQGVANYTHLFTSKNSQGSVGFTGFKIETSKPSKKTQRREGWPVNSSLLMNK